MHNQFPLEPGTDDELEFRAYRRAVEKARRAIRRLEKVKGKKRYCWVSTPRYGVFRAAEEVGPKDYRYCHVDSKGTPLYKERWDYVEDFNSFGFARVTSKKRHLYINRDGKVVDVEIRGDSVRVSEEGGPYYFVGLDGKRMTPGVSRLAERQPYLVSSPGR